MNLLYCGDRNVETGVFLSVLSFLAHTDCPLHVYLMTATLGDRCIALGEDDARRLEDCLQSARPGSSVTRIDASERFAAEPPTANLDTRFTPCCMLRLYADLCPELPERILYLDNDVLCHGDPTALWQTDMTDTQVAGVPDRYGSWFFRRHLFRRDYLNSGVLMLNLAEIRRTGLFARCRAYCAAKKMLLPDQSALNRLATTKKILPRIFNEQTRTASDTVLRHFTTYFRFFPRFAAVTVKPWQRDRMHTVLRDHAFDPVLDQYEALQATYQKEVLP
ncbi:MAG: glycosyltransferase family 8 protein [Clostridia bacterium]|nr:glycosyltransferase family 8 protein [Clostridia bacterium]